VSMPGTAAYSTTLDGARVLWQGDPPLATETPPVGPVTRTAAPPRPPAPPAPRPMVVGPPRPKVDPPPGVAVIQGQADGTLVVSPLPPGVGGDDAAVINAALLEAAHADASGVNGGGVVQLQPGTYSILSSIVVPAQSWGPASGGNSGYGAGAGPVALQGVYGATVLRLGAQGGTCIYCHRGSWWNPKQNSQPTGILPGARISDLIIDGALASAANAQSIGIDAGDMWGLQITGVMIRDFWTTTGGNFYSTVGSVGYYQSNVTQYTEKYTVSIQTVNCDNHVIVDSNAAGHNSHEYGDWDLSMYMLGGGSTASGNGQNGMTWINGSFMGNGKLFIRGNHGGGGAGSPGYVLQVGGGPNDAAFGYAQLYNCDYQVGVEGNGSSNLPQLVILAGANNVIKGFGQFQAQYAGWAVSNLNGGVFGVAGRISGDATLTTPPAFALAASGGTATYHGVDAAMYVSGGAVTNVTINGVSTPSTAGPFILRDGNTVKATYTGAPVATLVPFGI
jgi:hypothetical protein